MLGATSSRMPVGFNHISPAMRKAIIDTEDRRFYSNDGIDFIGILRSLKADVLAGGAVQGGSTIERDDHDRADDYDDKRLASPAS
jgi:membrane peptidoglycan carboxypeptidase